MVQEAAGSNPVTHPNSLIVVRSGQPGVAIGIVMRASSSIRQSNGLLIRRFGVRIPGGPPLLPGETDSSATDAAPTRLREVIPASRRTRCRPGRPARRRRPCRPESCGPQGDQPVDLRSLVTVGQDEIEALPNPPIRGGHGRASPCDLGAAVRRLDRGLLVLVPHQRPAQRLAPKEADLPVAVAGELPEEAAPGKVGIVPVRSRRTRFPRGRPGRRAPPRAVARRRDGERRARAPSSPCAVGRRGWRW